MALLKPFRGVRPPKSIAHLVASRPYDVLNSIEAMPQGGTLTIQAELDETIQMIVVKIIDTGEGIPDRIIDKVFQPFFTTKKGKTGIGLPKAERIIEAHRGDIKIEKNMDCGTAVTVTIPVI